VRSSPAFKQFEEPEKPLTVGALIQTQKRLQSEYDSALAEQQAAKTLYEERRAELVEFNRIYGRVIQMMEED